MGNAAKTLITFLLAGIIVLALYISNVPIRELQQVVIVLLAISLAILTGFQIPRFRHAITHRGKWFLLLLGTVIVQLFVGATGGIYSPFLILVHIYLIATSFFFPFYVPVTFILFALTGLIVQVTHDQHVMELFIQDPGTVILYGVTIVGVLPLARVLAQRYHLKTSSSNVLTNQLKVEEAILSDLHELVLVTDGNYKIMSLNDAVERTLGKSRSELLGHTIFSVLLMKDSKGNLINQGILGTQGAEHQMNTITDVSLFTHLGVRKVTLDVKPLNDLEGEVGQISFIINTPSGQTGGKNMVVVEEAQAKHDAMLEDLKKRLVASHLDDLKNRLLVAEKAESDISVVREIVAQEITEAKVPIDIARLCRQTVQREGEFANAFNVLADFSFVNFGQQDIAPLISNNMAISADQLTGPFFTALCDVKLLGLILEKLLAISVLTASAHDRTVRLTVEREGQTGLVIRIISVCNNITFDELPSLFVPYYGNINNKTNLRFGSGLEGFIAKSVSDKIHIPLQVTLLENPTRLSFMLWIEKGKAPSLATLSTQTAQKNSI